MTRLILTGFDFLDSPPTPPSIKGHEEKTGQNTTGHPETHSPAHYLLINIILVDTNTRTKHTPILWYIPAIYQQSFYLALLCSKSNKRFQALNIITLTYIIVHRNV